MGKIKEVSSYIIHVPVCIWDEKYLRRYLKESHDKLIQYEINPKDFKEWALKYHSENFGKGWMKEKM
ncbi:MAG: hypothetical protein HC831_02205 [Chloroflexia bacterium]|nr:hypothetical protein [Chloroflexia bacterium]